MLITKGSVKAFFSCAPGTALSPLRTALLVARSACTTACQTRASAAVLADALGRVAMSGISSFTRDSCVGTYMARWAVLASTQRMMLKEAHNIVIQSLLANAEVIHIVQKSARSVDQVQSSAEQN